MTIAQKLLRWYQTHGRNLPWRHTRDSYRILVSEVMLQQTQVSRVIGYYELWLQQFPDWASLASAKTDEVIHAWSGLGYNRRGLMLRNIAQHVVIHGEPKSEIEWRGLKGIGPYTAAALAAFSLKHRVLPIDTNIRRVLGRVFFGHLFPDLRDDEKIRGMSDQILPRRGKYYDIPQVLFDLATSICTKSPQCVICPLRTDCKSASVFLAGDMKTPKRTSKRTQETIHTGKKYPDRIYRGRILKTVKDSVRGRTFQEIAESIDGTFDSATDTRWVHAMLERLTKEGFLEQSKGHWAIAHG